MITLDNGNLLYIEDPGAAAAPGDFSAEEQAILDLVNRRVAAAQSLDHVMTFLFDSTRSVCPTDRLSLHFLDEDGIRMVAGWVRALYEPIHMKTGFVQNLEGSSLRSIISRGWLRIINDLGKYLSDHPGSEATRLLVAEGNASSLTCPLRVDDRIVGILFRSSRRPAAYDLHQVALHNAIAERLGQAVEKAYRIDQLAAANRAYMEMLGFVTHELKTPLATILMDAGLLSKGYLGELTPQQADRVRRIERHGHHLDNLIREYLELARMEGGSLRLNLQRDTDIVAEVLDPALETVGPLLRERGMRLVQQLPPDDIRADCDSNLLRFVLVNLLSNAVKYGNANGEIRLQVAREDSELRVSVRNEGAGFRPEDRVNLFRKFVRLQDPSHRHVQGTGVGLYTAWRVVCMHGGNMDAVSDYGRWAEFRFRMPLHAQPGAAGDCADATQAANPPAPADTGGEREAPCRATPASSAGGFPPC